MLSQIASTERLFVTCKFCGEFWQRRDRLFLGLDLPMTFCCLINCRRQYRRLLCTRSRPDPVELPWIDLGLVIAIAPRPRPSVREAPCYARSSARTSRASPPTMIEDGAGSRDARSGVFRAASVYTRAACLTSAKIFGLPPGLPL